VTKKGVSRVVVCPRLAILAPIMNPKALEILHQVIEKWKRHTRHSYEHKQVVAHVNPMVTTEGVLRFANAIYGFYCNGENMQIYLASEPFYTYGLSEDSPSENINGDKVRLEEHLRRFDEAFYAKADKALDDCADKLLESTPLFF